MVVACACDHHQTKYPSFLMSSRLMVVARARPLRLIIQNWICLRLCVASTRARLARPRAGGRSSGGGARRVGASPSRPRTSVLWMRPERRHNSFLFVCWCLLAGLIHGVEFAAVNKNNKHTCCLETAHRHLRPEDLLQRVHWSDRPNEVDHLEVWEAAVSGASSVYVCVGWGSRFYFFHTWHTYIHIDSEKCVVEML